MPNYDATPFRRRSRGQGGNEVIEFALFAIVFLPPLIWMFISGMNFVRFNKANDATRAAALMYLKNTDMTLLGPQEIIKRVAAGLDLQVDDGTAPPNQVLSNSRGSGLIVLSEVQYVGPATCPSGCTNLNQYVFLQRIYIGNTSLTFTGNSGTVTVGSQLGSPATGIWNSSTGMVSNPYGDAGAQVASSFASLWPSTLGDGQIVYVVESMFSGSFGTGQFGGGGIYTRILL